MLSLLPIAIRLEAEPGLEMGSVWKAFYMTLVVFGIERKIGASGKPRLLAKKSYSHAKQAHDGLKDMCKFHG